MNENIIMNKLYDFQKKHVFHLKNVLIKNNRTIDTSDTGTGKTYCAIAICALLNLKPFIICPMSTISNWIKVCNDFGIKYEGISNYQLLQRGKYYEYNIKNKNMCTYQKIKCPYIYIQTDKQIVEKKKKILSLNEFYNQNRYMDDFNEKFETYKKILENNELDLNKKYKIKYDNEYVCNFPENTIIIFDEAHRCKNVSNDMSKIMIKISESNNKIMLLSATLTDKLDCFKPFGVILKLYKTNKDYQKWIKNKYFINKLKYKNKDLTEDQIKLDIVHKIIFPEYGSSIKINQLGKIFPSNTIIKNSYFLEEHTKINNLYIEINNHIENLKKKEYKTTALGIITLNRMRIEMLKVSIYVELAMDAYESGYSVVIFVNFMSTLEYLCKHLHTDCIIKGGQSIEERNKNIDDFQSNKKKIIIVMIQAGGTGISLHDIHGGNPRMSLISLSLSGHEIKQALGRIYRAGSKTPAIQKIIYVANTYEERMFEMIENKLKNIDIINDGLKYDEIIDDNIYDNLVDDIFDANLLKVVSVDSDSSNSKDYSDDFDDFDDSNNNNLAIQKILKDNRIEEKPVKKIKSVVKQ